MSRRLNSNTRGRQPKPSSMRGPQLKLTFGGKSGQKNGAKEITTLANASKKRRLMRYGDNDSTTSGGETTDGEDHEVDEESEEADDESEDPEVDAPSHYDSLRGETGPPLIDPIPVDVPDNGEWTGFPEPRIDNAIHLPIFDEDFERRLFDSDDDSVYERVNDVSDNDDDEAIEQAETQLLTAEFNEDLTSHFANQIDGMSAYGFGDDSDEEGSIFFPFSSSDEANDIHHRHVHFEDHQPVGIEDAFAPTAQSPTMARALLPSALPDKPAEVVEVDLSADQAEDQDYDSDATEELEAPAQAWKSATSTQKSNKEEKSSSPETPKRSYGSQRGPVRGTFEDSGDKVTAILDPTGRKLLLSDPHLLGGVFARRFGPSVPTSPSVGFSEAVFGESDVSQASNSPQQEMVQSVPNVDPMFSGLTTGEHTSINGHTIGFPEAFIPTTSNFMKEFVAADIFDDDIFDPEQMLSMDDMIVFDGENTEDENADSPMLPNNFFSGSLSAPNTPLPHLNHMNVTAFKRNTESNYFATSPHPAPLRNKLATPLKRKRKPAKYDSPYNDAHYHGVTPVQRVTAADHELPSSPAPSSVHTHKRRKTIL